MSESRTLDWSPGALPYMIDPKLGLCPGCRHVRIIRSDRGSIFYQCLLAAVDPRFPKYPRLPVLSCPGYEAKEESDEAPRSS